MRGALTGALLWLATAPAWGGGVLPVVTTTTDLKALVEAVGGARVRVVSLAPPLHDPHSVEVKPGVLAELRSAALLVRIGLDHEPWLARPLRAVGDARLRPGGPADVDVSRGIALLDAETPRVRAERGVHVHGFGNPHYWLDPENARPITERIQGALARLAPDDAALFEANRARVLRDLGAFDIGRKRIRPNRSKNRRHRSNATVAKRLAHVLSHPIQNIISTIMAPAKR